MDKEKAEAVAAAVAVAVVVAVVLVVPFAFDGFFAFKEGGRRPLPLLLLLRVLPLGGCTICTDRVSWFFCSKKTGR